MREKQEFHIGVGVPSILMIFVVLCLTTFGVLSYSSAKADSSLTEKNGEHIKNYYAADAKAQTILSEIDEILYEAKTAAKDQHVYEETVTSLLMSMDTPVAVGEGVEDYPLTVSYEVALENGQTLEVELGLLPFNIVKRYEVLSYCINQSKSAAIEIEEETPGLWQGR